MAPDELFDLFRMGGVVVGTVNAVRDQRSLARNLAALPMGEFVREGLLNLNQSGGAWHGRARPANRNATAIAVVKQLPPELAEFYFALRRLRVVDGEFPASILRIVALRPGADHRPPLSRLLRSFWNEHGNESEQPGSLSILPPSHVHPSVVDRVLPLCPPHDRDFVVILLADASPRLPRGTVLEVEGGSATRYDGRGWRRVLRCSARWRRPCDGHAASLLSPAGSASVPGGGPGSYR